MNREREVFARALEFESDSERQAYLSGACANDEGLRERVASLLGAHLRADDESFLPNAVSPDPVPMHEGEGSRIGPYRLLQKIGEGGFGVVYMAEQREPIRRRVALKIIKLGMDTRNVVGRFEAERQALAMMDHPNIAKVLDAGSTSSGRPYFVMDLVRGVPLLEFCDGEKLPPADRLRLFLDICGAVEHAHQKGIIHRDLKPSNVLVTFHDERPLAKVIDFGIAKATQQDLTDKTLFTRYEDFVGTPAYMSPEQAGYTALDIDTRTDIYSLGVLLYELLTGRTPFDGTELRKAGLDEIRRRIREEEPLRPSTQVNTMEHAAKLKIARSRLTDPARLDKLLRGELDWIVMKAMEKDRQRRYATANALAGDLRRFLRGDPVEACPPSRLYRLRKFARKHRFVLAVMASFTLALTIGAILSGWQAIRASQSSRDAVEARRDATQQLWHAYLHQARATRQTGLPGHRVDCIDAIRKAAAIRPSPELRNEALAALVLPDLQQERSSEFEIPARGVAALDPTGTLYALGDREGTVRIHRFSDHTELQRLPGHDGPIRALRFGPGRRYLAAGVISNETRRWVITIWDLRDESLEPRLTEKQTNGFTLSFQANRNRVAVATRDPSIRIFDLATGEKVREVASAFPADRLSFQPSGSLLAASRGSRTDLHLYDLDDESNAAVLNHPRGAYDHGWSPDGKLLAVAGEDFTTTIWEVATRSRVQTIRGHRAEVVRARFHPRRPLVFTTAWDSTSRVWDYRTGRELIEAPPGFEEFAGDGSGVSFSPRSSVGGIWRFLPAVSGFDHFHLAGDLRDKVISLSFSPDGNLLAAGADRAIAVWDLRTRSRVSTVDIRGTRSVRFSPSSGDLLSCGVQEGIRHWRFETVAGEGGTADLVLKEQRIIGSGSFQRLDISHDGRRLAALQDGRVHLIDLASGSLSRVIQGQPGINNLVLGPRDNWLAGKSWRGRGVRIWNLLEDPAPSVDFMEEEPTAGAAISPDGTELITATAEGYQFWEIGTWKKTGVLPRSAGTGIPGPVSYQPGGRLIALSKDEKLIQLVDRATHELIAELRPPHQGLLRELVFSPDGRRLAAGTSERDIYVWDLPSLRRKLAELGLDWDD